MTEEIKKSSRRTFLKSAAVGAAVLSLEEKILVAATEGAHHPPPPDPAAAGDMPMGKIGNLNISRMICGGNLISGYSHSRDLVYVSKLMTEYNTVERIMDTLALCEQHGINAVLSDPGGRPKEIINKYWKERGGKIQWIIDCRPEEKDIKERIDSAIEAGGSAVYVNGGWAENWVRDGKTELLGKCVEYIRTQGMPGGIGGHMLEVPVACEKAGIKPDFYMKTLHSKQYWSAEHASEHDNIWCRKPEETIEFMKNVKVPWIAYKTLAAGAISPTTGFKYALQNGADFACIGMFDFQVAQDVQIFKGLFARGIQRERAWMA